MHSRRFTDSTIVMIDVVITINFITSSNLIRANLIIKQFPREAIINDMGKVEIINNTMV